MNKPKRPDGYYIWGAMISRCYYTKNIQYKNYGGKGIKVCDRWKNSFKLFMEDMGPRPSSKHTVDRYPNQRGNYEPGNCRWATMKEQQNNRTNNVLLTHNNKTQTVSQWSEELGVSSYVLFERIKKGKFIGDKLFTGNKKLIHYDGKSLTADKWEEIIGIKANTIRKRLSQGWSIEKALTVKAKFSKSLPNRKYGKKINFQIAENIRADKISGLSIKELCIKYELSKITITRIISNKSWIKEKENE